MYMSWKIVETLAEPRSMLVEREDGRRAFLRIESDATGAVAGLADTPDGPFTEIIARAETEGILTAGEMTEDLHWPILCLLNGIDFPGGEEEGEAEPPAPCRSVAPGARLRILECRWALTGGGDACGPVPAGTVVSLRVPEEDGQVWLHFVLMDGTVSCVASGESLHDVIAADGPDLSERLEGKFISGLDRVVFGDMEETILSLREEPNPSVAALVRLVLAIWEGSKKEANALCRAAKGNFPEEMDIPLTEAEEDLLEEEEEEEE